ncbi:MAG: Npt1/Npt2 family nucleotide transporter [Holophaga sp.]|jgi:AAA family ATP:ADP antiporter
MGAAGYSNHQEFGKWRQRLWPIHAYELKKFFPMFLMFFFISFVYSILRNTKDTLIVTAPDGGADLIPFLKAYGTIPLSVVFMLVFAKLSNVLSKRQLFYAALMPFLVFFALFPFLYSIRELVQPVEAFAHWHHRFPPWLATLASMVRHWTFALFYVMAELWGSMALSWMFWGFANDIVKVEESKRFYALFGLGANLALVAVKFANQFIHVLERRLVALRPMAGWTAYLDVLMVVIVLCILAIFLIYRWIHRHVLTDPRFYTPEDTKELRAARPRMSLKEAFTFLARSRYLQFIAVLVLCYGIAINLIEVTWKTHLGLLKPNPKDYQDFMANFALYTGLTALVMMLFVANNVIRRYGWTVAALATPVVLAVTGTGFFGFILFEDRLAGFLAAYGTTPLAMAVLFGTVQNVLSKTTKYSLFDPTKEMAYIPLDPESKVKGKAAIDVVGARLGKAGGSVIQQALIAVYHSLRAVPGQIAGILLVVIGAWMWADLGLGRAFGRLTRAREKARPEPQPGEPVRWSGKG